MTDPSDPDGAIRRSRFADAMRLSSEQSTHIEAGEDYSDDFARVKAEARDTYGEGRLGLLKWIDARGQMMRPALHALDPLWIEAFGSYYDSGKLIMLARKGLRAGGSSSACPALVRCAMFTDRRLDAGTIGVIPIMSATRDEADGRFITIRAYLRACGFTPPEKSRSEDDADGRGFVIPSGGIAGTFKSKRSQSGGGIIWIEDANKQEIEFRILPALVRHGVGYTGVAGFADESDLWPNDPEHHINPAERIFDRISERFTTTFPGAEMLIFSASYNADSAHKKLVDEGDTPLQHLVRVGTLGAERDAEARRMLASEIKSNDPRLLAPGDPTSPDLPAWVFNPEQAPIVKCYSFSKGNINRMLGLYGGRAAENARNNSPLGSIEITLDERETSCADIVIGVAPPDETSREWGIIAVGLAASGGLIVLEDASGAIDGRDAAGRVHALCVSRRASVLAVAAAWAPLVEEEVLAAFAGAGIPLAPVAPQGVHDGGLLRIGPLRTLYQRGSLRHAVGLDAIGSAVHGWTPERRMPAVEALVAAVARLRSCYPWLDVKTEDEPMRGPPTIDATYGGGIGLRGLDMVRRLGGR